MEEEKFKERFPLVHKLAKAIEDKGMRIYYRSCDNCIYAHDCKDRHPMGYCKDHEIDKTKEQQKEP